MKKPRLVANWDDGEGDLVIPPEWRALDPVIRLDFLIDWIALLEDEFELAHTECYGKKSTEY